MDASGYEATVTKADESTVEVDVDSSFNAVHSHGGHGHGDRGGQGAPSSTG